MTTSHSNKVTISTEGPIYIESATYNGGSLRATAGQPTSPPPTIDITQDPCTCTITVDCGRKGSSAMAANFGNAVNNEARHAYAPSYGGGLPEELNFLFGVTLQIVVEQHSTVPQPLQVWLGQGHAGDYNNWWLGCLQLENVQTTGWAAHILAPFINEVLPAAIFMKIEDPETPTKQSEQRLIDVAPEIDNILTNKGLPKSVIDSIVVPKLEDVVMIKLTRNGAAGTDDNQFVLDYKGD